MMEVIAQYKKHMEMQGGQAPIEDPKEQSGGDVVPEQEGGTNEHIGELHPFEQDLSWSDIFWNIIKIPLFVTVIFIIFSNEKCKSFIYDTIESIYPSIVRTETLKYLVLAGLFFLNSLILNEIIKMS